LANSGIISVKNVNTGLLYINRNFAQIYSYDDTSPAVTGTLNYTANTPYLVAVQWGDLISNVNNYRIGAVALDTAWTSGAWGSDAEFDGAYTLGTALNFFYSKFGSTNIREVRFYDRILTDSQIEVIRRSVQ
jgi:hypothetical protein